MLNLTAKLNREIETLKWVRNLLDFHLSMEASASRSDRRAIEDLCNEIIDIVYRMEKEDEE